MTSTGPQPGQAARPALEVLADAAAHAGADRADEARALLRTLLPPARAAELAKAPPGRVESYLLVVGGCRGLGSLAASVQAAVALARPTPDPGTTNGPTRQPGALTVTAALGAAGYPGASDLPPLPVPAGYRFDASGIWREREDGDAVRVCAVPLAVVGRSVGIGTGRVRLTLVWPYGRCWRVESAARAHALSGRSLLEALGDAGIPCDGSTAAGLASWIAAAEHAADAVLPESRSQDHLGWTPDLTGFALSSGTLGEHVEFVPPGEGDAQAGYGKTAGNIDGWKSEVWTPLSPHPGALAVIASLAAPLLRLVGADHGFTVEYAAGPGTGKTTAGDAAASVWGDPKDVVLKWPKTYAGSREAIKVRRGVPTSYDESQNVRRDSTLIADTLYLVGGTAVQPLGAAAGGTRAQGSVETILISTGEARAADRCNDAPGALARLISIGDPAIAPGNRDLVHRIKVGSSTHYGHAGPAFVRWLLANRGEWPRIRARYDQLLAWQRDTAADDAAARVGAHLALLYLASELATEALGIVVPPAVLQAGGAAVVDRATERDVPLTALRDAHGWWVARRQGAAGSVVVHGARIGWDAERVNEGRAEVERIDGVTGSGDPIAWLPEALRKALSELGYQPASIIRSWGERGWLREQGGGYQPRIRRELSGDSRGGVRCYVWSPAAFDALDPDTKDEGGF